MEVPAKFRSISAGFRYCLLALLFLALSAYLVSCGGSGTSITITTDAGDVSSIVLTIAEDPIVAGGLSTTTVTAELFDFDGNPAKDGTTVNYVVEPAGTIPATATTNNGTAQVILTSATTAGEYYITATAGDVSQIAVGEYIAGPAAAANTTLSANPDSIDADGASTSEITLVAQDANNNPIADGTTVNWYTSEGTLSAATGTTSNGIASVTLTSSTNDNTVATVTAIVGPVNIEVQVGFGAVVVIGEGSGTANAITLDVAQTSIRVKNSGGNETTVIEATAKDESNAPITNCTPENNIRFEIINGPGGGEKLDGTGPIVEKSTNDNGVATATLSAGTVSGTVNIQVSVILNGECVNDDLPASGYYATAITTRIAIEAGQPANIVIFQDNLVTANNDGSISQTFSALVQDLHGNPVENGTGVFFGLVDNPNSAAPPYQGYLAAGADGATTGGGNSFTSAGSSFVADGVVTEDILIILEGSDEGGHRVSTVNNDTSLNVYNTFNVSAGNLDFVAGSAELGTVCGSVQTGNLEMNSSCTPTSVGGEGSTKGVAHTTVTWIPWAIFKPFNLYAESVGGDVGDTLADAYPAVAPVSATVTVAPSSVQSGVTGISAVAAFEDGAGNPIQGENVVFSSSTPAAAFISGPGTVVSSTSGMASTTVDTGACLASNANVTITAAIGPYVGTGTLSVSATAPTANFNCTDAGDGLNSSCGDSSTTPSGTTLAVWAWDLDCNGGTDSTLQNPIFALGVGTTPVCLTVTNNAGCTSQISKAVVVAAP